MVTELHRAGMPVVRACALLDLPRSTYYRIAHDYTVYTPVTTVTPHAQRHQPNRLSQVEQQSVIDALSRDELQDESVAQTYWECFDDGTLTMSLRTFYRYADTFGLVGDRRRRRPSHSDRRAGPRGPVATARAPGDVWSWDVTELVGSGRRRFKLYLVIDVFSRYPVAWRIEHREDKDLAVDMFVEAIARHGAPRAVHADNGGIMRSEVLLDELDKHQISATFSRPRVSDDNPFSESLFRTIKYDLSCPERFDDIDHARAWTCEFLTTYATKRRHSRMGWYTPEDLLTGHAEQVRAARQARLDELRAANPGRFTRPPTAPAIPQSVGARPTTNNNHNLSQAG